MSHRLPSNAEVAILELLADRGDLYGLELVSGSGGRLKRGTIYVTLARMQDKGLVRALPDPAAEQHSGLPRPRYRITALGSRSLEAARLVDERLRLVGRTA